MYLTHGNREAFFFFFLLCAELFMMSTEEPGPKTAFLVPQVKSRKLTSHLFFIMNSRVHCRLTLASTVYKLTANLCRAVSGQMMSQTMLCLHLEMQTLEGKAEHI